MSRSVIDHDLLKTKKHEKKTKNGRNVILYVLPDQVFNLVEWLMRNQKPTPTLARLGLNIEFILTKQTGITTRVVTMDWKLRKVASQVRFN